MYETSALSPSWLHPGVVYRDAKAQRQGGEAAAKYGNGHSDNYQEGNAIGDGDEDERDTGTDTQVEAEAEAVLDSN